MVVGGVGICLTGVGCPASPGAVVAGTTAIVHGTAVAVNSATSRGEISIALMSNGNPSSTQAIPPNTANYTKQSRNHVYSHGHAANSPRIPNKSRFLPTEGGQQFTDEVVNHQNVVITHQRNGRVLYEVNDLGRNVGYNRAGHLTRGGAVVVEGQNPAHWSTYIPNEVVTQYPR